MHWVSLVCEPSLMEHKSHGGLRVWSTTELGQWSLPVKRCNAYVLTPGISEMSLYRILPTFEDPVSECY